MPAPLIHVAGLDVERGHEDAFATWYRGEHVPRVLERAGWSRARRYECLDGEPRVLTVFELEPSAADGALSAAPFRHPTFGRRIRNYHARTLREIHAAGEDPALAKLVNVMAVDVEARHAGGFSRWYNDVHVPEILACPGWRGARRYEALDGDPRFMAIYGLEDAVTPFATAAYEAAVGWDEHVDAVRGYHGFRIYRLVDTIEAGS